MGKKVLGTILLIGLGAAVTLGAIRAFGAPQEILPEDEKMMECIGTVIMDDFVENSKYRKSSAPTYGDSYTLELFEYTLDSKEDIQLRLLNYIDEDGKGFSDTRVIESSGPRGAGFTILNSKVHYVEMDYYSTTDRDIQTYKSVMSYAGDGTDYMGIFGAEECAYSQHLTNLNSAGENLEEIVSISFYRFKNDPIEVEETKVSNKVTIDLTYDGKLSKELTGDEFLDLLNVKNKDIFEIDTDALIVGMYLEHGGVYLDTGEFSFLINTDDYEFNRAKIVAGNIKNEEISSTGYFNDQHYVLYTDYDDGEDELITEIYLKEDNAMEKFSFGGDGIVIYSITFWNETVVEAE